MKNKKVIAISAIVLLVLIVCISLYMSKKGNSGETENNSTNTSTTNVSTPTTKLKDPAFLPPNDRRYYYDSVYYHKDRNCKNHKDKDYISENTSSINGLLGEGKKPCPVCVPEDEAKENREGRKQ